MSFMALCLFQVFYWVHDIISFVKMWRYNELENKVVTTVTNLTKLFFFFVPIKILWASTSIIAMNYLSRFEELPNPQTVFAVLGGLEFTASGILVIFFILFVIDFIEGYLTSLRYGARCSFKFFKKIYKISDFTSDNTNIIYKSEKHTKMLNFSFIPLILACFMLNKKYNKHDKDKDLEDQKAFYKMVIQDLQEKQVENEKKAQEYLSRAQKNEEDILNNFHKTLELQKKHK